MLTFFEYLRNRAYESIIQGANEALEYLEKDKSNSVSDATEFLGLPRKRESLDFQKPEREAEDQQQGETSANEEENESLPAPPPRSSAKKRVEQSMTDREKEILRALAMDVCTFSDLQVAQAWWSDNANGLYRTRQTLRQLEKKGWLILSKMLARSIKPSTNPVYCWRPGDSKPDFRLHSRILHNRSKQNPKLISICVATAKTYNLFGTGKRTTVRLAQLTHELQVSEIYLRYRNSGFNNFRWLSESRLPPEWRLRVRPDALLTDADGNFLRAIEYGGDYLPERLEELHAALSSILLSYELW